MHLFDIISLRATPAGCLALSVTRRCPLSCAHCITESSLAGEDPPEESLLRIVESFTPSNRPDLLMLSGGEALLRPWLVKALADRAHAVGAEVALISGMFFARQPEAPSAIRAAIASVDQFTASMDFHHEQQVPRAAVFRELHKVLDQGKDVSIQSVGLGEHDPYLMELTEDIQREFDGRIPVLVGTIAAVGRAAEWMENRPAPAVVNTEPFPCILAAWPVVTFDGDVVACCSQRVVDGPAPSHLRLGHVSVDSWAAVRERCLSAPLLRGIRVFGPDHLASYFGSGKAAGGGGCSTCLRLSEDPTILERLAPVLARPTMSFIEAQVAAVRAEYLVRARGIPAYAHLVKLGYEPGKKQTCAV